MKEKRNISLVVRVTENCNLRCVYCYMGEKKAKEMSLETAERLVSSFLGYNSDYFHFTWVGGEPLLKPDSFFESISKFSKDYNKKELKVSHSIQTNGVLLSQERFNHLRGLGFKIGISYDGCSDIQDKQRVNKQGKGFSDKVFDIIKMSNKRLGIVAVLTKNSIGREKEIFENIKPITNYIRINFYSPLGYGNVNGKEFMPSKEEADQMLINFYNLWKEDNSNLIFRPFSDIIRAFFTGKMLNCDYSAVSCYSILGSNSEGDIYLCSRAVDTPEMKLGNIYKNKLEEMIDSPLHEKILDRYFYLKEKINDPWFRFSCGGCPVEAYSYTGDMMNEGYYGHEVRNSLFKLIFNDLKNEPTRTRLEKKIRAAG